MKKSAVKLFLGYLSEKRMELYGLVLVFGVFIFLLWLYQAPMGGVWYACGITMVFYGVIQALGFVRFQKRYRMLERLEQSVDELMGDLPSPDGSIEGKYQELIEKLAASRDEIRQRKEEDQKTMTEYYALWAHQIKTPIAAISSLVQADDGPFTADYLDQLFRIQQYVEMVLQYVRAEDMGRDLKLDHYELDPVVRQAVHKYTNLAKSSQVEIEYKGISLEVVTDEKWLGFVIEQVLSNAIKYSKAHGRISIYPNRRRGDILVIEDHGIGISQEDLPRIFENGYTGQNGRTDKKSTGIGLYLCKKIMTKLGHGIRVASRTNEGTMVLLDFGEAASISRNGE